MRGYLLRAEADEALKRLGELRHLIDEYNKWNESWINQLGKVGGRLAEDFIQARQKWHKDIVDLATQVVGL